MSVVSVTNMRYGGDDVDDADVYKGQQGGCRARSLWQYGLPMHRLNILNLPALKMMIPVRILMVLIMTMVLMIDDNDDDCEDVDNGDGEAAFEDLYVATKVLSVKINFRNPLPLALNASDSKALS